MSRRRRGVIRQCVIDNDFAGRTKRAAHRHRRNYLRPWGAMHRPSTIEEGGERRLRRMSGQELAKALEWLRQKPIEGLPSVLSRLSNCVHTADAIVPEWCGIQEPVEMATGVFSVGRNYQGTGNRGERSAGGLTVFSVSRIVVFRAFRGSKDIILENFPFTSAHVAGTKNAPLPFGGGAFECQLLLSGVATACRPELPRRSCCRR